MQFFRLRDDKEYLNEIHLFHLFQLDITKRNCKVTLQHIHVTCQSLTLTQDEGAKISQQA